MQPLKKLLLEAAEHGGYTVQDPNAILSTLVKASYNQGYKTLFAGSLEACLDFMMDYIQQLTSENTPPVATFPPIASSVNLR